eukprot:m.95777 g.95777  ORF g.95777 m.95777 type:complete len:124 (+) comp18447_c0_seq3:172-543(+)
MVLNRTDVQCRERYKNVEEVKLHEKAGAWTEEEDAALTEAVEIHGIGNWSVAADFIRNRLNKTRTDDHCRRRFQRLHPELSSAHRHKRHVEQSVGLRSFAGRTDGGKRCPSPTLQVARETAPS